MKYAWVENNKIRDVAIDPVEQFVAEVAKFYDTEVDDSVQNGAELVNGSWVNPVPPKSSVATIHITVPDMGQINVPIVANVSVTFEDGSPAPVEDTYYVPILRLSDNKQVAFLAIKFVNGSATVEFTVTEPGVYVMDTNSIRPIPTATITDRPEIIVI